MWKKNNKTIDHEQEKQLKPSLHRFDTVKEFFCFQFCSYSEKFR